MTTLNVQTAITCSTSKVIVFGVTLIFPQIFKTSNEARLFLQTTYFDQLGADGLCRLVDRERPNLFSIDYWQHGLVPEPKLEGIHQTCVSNENKKACLRTKNGVSHLDILLGNTNPGAYQSEAEFMTQELNTYKEEGFILGWEQFAVA